MKPPRPLYQWFVPDGTSTQKALGRTTHLGIGAHPDDLEFMCLHGIASCFNQKHQWFTGVVVTDGRGSVRGEPYQGVTDQKLVRLREKEQQKAARIGRYSCLISLQQTSRRIKSSGRTNLVSLLKEIIQTSTPQYIYTHNLADKHDTHVAVSLAVISALRKLPKRFHPKGLYGCEVWRGLDWMLDQDKVCFDVSSSEKLGLKLSRVFNSQISGGKRYDLAVLGRKRSNATFFNSHRLDFGSLVEYAMDLTPLLRKPTLSISKFIQKSMDRFQRDVLTKIQALTQN